MQPESAELATARRVKRPLPMQVQVWKWTTRFFARKPLGAVGATIIFVMVAMAVLAPVITYASPTKMGFQHVLEAPSAKYWLGTDDFGRDLWARIVYGARISLYVGFLSVLFGNIGGALAGLVSAFYGGKVDAVIQRFMDGLMAIPTLVLALAIMAALGQSLNNVVLAISANQIPGANRIVRSVVLSVKESEYVLAARALGATNIRIMLQHVMPQCIAPWLIIATQALGSAIVAEASLSFLGLGVPQPTPSWGGMLSGKAREYYAVAPWLAIWPGLSISLAVYGFNLFGDAIRDVLDPRLRGT
jgi:peptide/nickel transport system permease protein